MRYIPNSKKARTEMLHSVGLGTVESLFSVIPEEFRLKSPISLPPPENEQSLYRHMADLAGQNEGSDLRTCILGGGAYHHYIPAVVSHVLSRSEFYTAYTPYQPEISQGTLQAIFEYQTMISSLMGLEVSNASLYDGSSATAEAVLMALRQKGGGRVVVSRALNPVYRQVIETYLQHAGVEIIEVGCDASGRTDYRELAGHLGGDTACFVIQNPNFFGVIEDGDQLRDMRSQTSSLLVAAVTETVSLGLLAPPGDWGADIASAEGQSLGNSLGYGGPYLGILTTHQDLVRQMPGRLVGETVDARGKRGFVLTLATREQHIRRERATSNICSNEGLCALAAAVHLSTLGPAGLECVAGLNVLRTRRAIDGLKKLKGWSFPFGGPVFNEFVAVPEKSPARVQKILRKAGFSGALELDKWYPEIPGALLFCFTEMVSEDEVDRFLATLEKCNDQDG